MFWVWFEFCCWVYGLCGFNGFCYEDSSLLLLKVCGCLVGFGFFDEFGWVGGDFFGGCWRVGGEGCDEKRDGFEVVGIVIFDGVIMMLFQGVGSRGDCEKDCLVNCFCVGVIYNGKINLCKNLFGLFVNFWNLLFDSIIDDGVFYLRVGKSGLGKKN